MELINVKEFGYGQDGKTLDMVIAIPKDCFLETFYILDHNEIEDLADISESKAPVVPIKERGYKKDYAGTNFSKYFEAVSSEAYDFEIDGEKYKLYRTYTKVSISPEHITIPVDPNALTFVCMQLDEDNASLSSYSCSEIKKVFPLYDSIALKLKALNAAKLMPCCEYPAEFIDKILQIKAIELLLIAQEFYKAAQYWKKFYKNEKVFNTKNCNCHG